MRENVYENGRFLDSLILTITRERWESRVRPLIERRPSRPDDMDGADRDDGAGSPTELAGESEQPEVATD